MKTEDMILVSVDDHVVEPPDMFESHLAARYKDLAPKVIQNAHGDDVWFYEGQELPNIGLNAVAGKPPAEYGIEPTTFAEMRPGCYDIHERIRDMDANGVLGSMCFPSFPQFCGQLFSRTEDKTVALAMLQAYNDWHIDEWCGTYPGRFIPLSLPPIWDPQLMAAEIHRVAAQGLPRRHVLGEPGEAGMARASTASTGTRSSRRVWTRGRSCACTSGRPPSSRSRRSKHRST